MSLAAVAPADIQTSASPRAVDAPPAVARSGTTARLFHLRECEAAGQVVLQQFIKERFEQAYGARVSHFLPRLFGVHSAQDELLAAFGLRSAAGSSLFLEQYLDAPVESILSGICRGPVARHEIVEVGNLAGRHRGVLRVLIPLLAEWLVQEKFRWLVFTGNPQLAAGFARMGIQLRNLAPANIERLPASEREAWGSYYEHAPSVLLGDIEGGRQFLMQHPELLAHLSEAGSSMPGAGN